MDAPRKKRRSSRDEKDDDSSRSKRRKESASHHRGSSGRHLKRSKRSGHKRTLQVRSISELVKLVSSGAVRVPKSLVHYVDDRTQLLDQVFTILSADDIKGMLPDILKGLRMKQVKQLCYEQLKHMPIEEVKETIQPETSQELEADLNSILTELLGKELQQEESRQSSRSRSRSTSVGKEDEQKGSDGSETSGGLPMESPPKENESSVREFVIRVSDISEDEGKGGGGGRKKRKGVRGKQHRLPDHECTESSRGVLAGGSSRPPQGNAAERVDTEDEIELDARLSGDQIDRELCETSGKQSTAREADHDERSRNSSDREIISGVEEDWDLSYAPDVPESARLLEMELRKKALESELKRSGLQPSPQESQDVNRYVDDTREQVVVSERGAEEERSDVDVESAVDESGELELKLRQRALQSLLAKRKQTEST